MKLKLTRLLFAVPAIVCAQQEGSKRDYFDDPFLMGGTKSVLLRPLAPGATMSGSGNRVEIVIPPEYRDGITFFKFYVDTTEPRPLSRNFTIHIRPNNILIRQDLTGNPRKLIIVNINRPFRRIIPANAGDNGEAFDDQSRPWDFLITGGGGSPGVDCPSSGDCNFVLGGRRRTR